jgi:protein-S-isoprenylcysteine O-methyltransferase Ste14
MDFGMMTGFIVEIFIIPFYIGLIPFEPRFCPKSKLSPLWKYMAWGLTGLFSLIAALLLFYGGISLGVNLTPLPHPKDDGKLVTTGAYGIVRHPIYSGVIFLAIAYSCWRWSLIHAIGAAILLLFFDIKARKEEAWLKNKFSDYNSYQLKVKKLIPWLY